MKLYNKTKCPDEIIEPILIAAGKSVGARTTNVVVKVTQTQKRWTRGHVWGQSAVYKAELATRQYKKDGTYRFGKVKTDCAYMTIGLPGLHHGLNVIQQAVEGWKVMQHEWAHVRDFQKRKWLSTPTTPSGRQIKWRDRPCEISAECQVSEANNPENVKTMIRNLAIYYKDKTQAKYQMINWNPERLIFGNEDVTEYRNSVNWFQDD